MIDLYRFAADHCDVCAEFRQDIDRERRDRTAGRYDLEPYLTAELGHHLRHDHYKRISRIMAFRAWCAGENRATLVYLAYLAAVAIAVPTVLIVLSIRSIA